MKKPAIASGALARMSSRVTFMRRPYPARVFSLRADDAGHRLDTLGIDRLQLIHPVHDLAEFRGEVGSFRLGDADAGEPRDPGNRCSIERHCTPSSFGQRELGIIGYGDPQPALALKALASTPRRQTSRSGNLDLAKRPSASPSPTPDLPSPPPIDTIRRVKFTEDVKQLAKLMAGREVGGIVVGLPINMDGTQGPRCQSVRHFAENLLARRPLGGEPEIAFWDERLSTAVVQRLLTDEVDMRRNKRAQAVDKMAAAYILQGALDALATPAQS